MRRDVMPLRLIENESCVAYPKKYRRYGSMVEDNNVAHYFGKIFCKNRDKI